MEFLKKIDQYLDVGLKYFTGTLMIILTIIVNIMVFSRYVLRVNLGGIEELPVYLMIVCVWMGSIRVARDDNFVKIELIQSLVKGPKGQNAIKIVTSLISALVLSYFTTCAYSFFHKSLTYQDISPSIGFPIWWVHIFMFLGSLGLTVYFWLNTIRYIRRCKEL